jgi:hypothetical protein
LPGPEEEFVVIRRILEMLQTTPASRVATVLTNEGIPSPDASRYRTDQGVRHPTSGVWHQPTILNIARNSLLLAVTSYGRRSMGDELRFSPDGPRHLTERDLRADGQPKVVINPESQRVSASAKFEPLVDSAGHRTLLEALDRRAGTQRGKPRSKTPASNPLGARIFDMGCGWPMYRQPYNGSFRYLCGLYQQSHAAQCRHNHVDGKASARFLLSCVRQRVLPATVRAKIEQKVRARGERELARTQPDSLIAAQKAALVELRRKQELASKNLALAESAEQHRAIASVFDQLSQDAQRIEANLRETERSADVSRDLEREVAAALARIGRIAELASDPTNLESIGELIRFLNARLFLRFAEARSKNRTINKVAGGVVTFGASPPPVTLYEGPTGRRALQGRPRAPDCISGAHGQPTELGGNDREGESLGNVNRGERI